MQPKLRVHEIRTTPVRVKSSSGHGGVRGRPRPKPTGQSALPHSPLLPAWAESDRDQSYRCRTSFAQRLNNAT